MALPARCEASPVFFLRHKITVGTTCRAAFVCARPALVPELSGNYLSYRVRFALGANRWIGWKWRHSSGSRDNGPDQTGGRCSAHGREPVLSGAHALLVERERWFSKCPM